jgi:hypothetical protein
MVNAMAVVGIIVAIVAACATAYAVGRRRGQGVTIPWRPIFQIVDHRHRCLGHDRARVERDLGSLLPVPPWAWDELLALRRPLDTVVAHSRRERVAGP